MDLELVRDISHFISKDGMSIEGLGSIAVKELVANKKLTKVVDLYDLTPNDLISIGYPKEQARQVILSISKTVNCSLRRLIRSLNIEGMSDPIARDLDLHFGYAWHNTDRVSLKKVATIESKNVIAILTFIKKKETYGLKELMDTIKPTTEFNPYINKAKESVRITFTNITPSEQDTIKKYMKLFNMTYSAMLDKKVKFLVVGSDTRETSARVNLAKKYNVTVISYQDFIETFKKISYGK